MVTLDKQSLGKEFRNILLCIVPHMYKAKIQSRPDFLVLPNILDSPFYNFLSAGTNRPSKSRQ